MKGNIVNDGTRLDERCQGENRELLSRPLVD